MLEADRYWATHLNVAWDTLPMEVCTSFFLYKEQN